MTLRHIPEQWQTTCNICGYKEIQSVNKCFKSNFNRKGRFLFQDIGEWKCFQDDHVCDMCLKELVDFYKSMQLKEALKPKFEETQEYCDFDTDDCHAIDGCCRTHQLPLSELGKINLQKRKAE